MTTLRAPWPALLSLSAALACGGSGGGGSSSEAPPSDADLVASAGPGALGSEADEDESVAPGGRVHVVRPGESIQAAVEAAAAGDTVLVQPGTYREAGRPCPTNPDATCAVVISTDGIRLVGARGPHGRDDGRGRAAGPVLENAGGQDQGIAIAKVRPAGARNADCFTQPEQHIAGNVVSGFTVRGFAGEGIFLFCADDFRVTRNATLDNLEYGIFPSHSARGRVRGNVATGANDTGIYIGQSHDVRVSHNLAQGNVSGFEIENCTGVRLDHNVATGNTGGILSFTLPGLDLLVNEDNVVERNVVVANDKDNTCTDPSDTVCLVPSGTGILLLAADRNTVRGNLVARNRTAGIAVFDFCTATGTPPDACAGLGIDPSPDGNRIVGNRVAGNGNDPDVARLPPGVPGADLLWSGVGTGNCWSRNGDGTVFSPVPLPACPNP
ncbi:MAG TPA: parallel beta-helix domain-containing protein [Anaeromyxobacteraceae bacterium]|nr:parallel beta-helix domain-containing protein [Anaeromyxobacteraceae bacterium]